MPSEAPQGPPAPPGLSAQPMVPLPSAPLPYSFQLNPEQAQAVAMLLASSGFAIVPIDTPSRTLGRGRRSADRRGYAHGRGRSYRPPIPPQLGTPAPTSAPTQHALVVVSQPMGEAPSDSSASLAIDGGSSVHHLPSTQPPIESMVFMDTLLHGEAIGVARMPASPILLPPIPSRGRAPSHSKRARGRSRGGRGGMDPSLTNSATNSSGLSDGHVEHLLCGAVEVDDGAAEEEEPGDPNLGQGGTSFEETWRTWKWWVRDFQFFFGVSEVNAYLLWRQYREPQLAMTTFRRRLTHQMLHNAWLPGRSVRHRGRPDQEAEQLQPYLVAVPGCDLQSGNGRRRCCGCGSLTRWCCSCSPPDEAGSSGKAKYGSGLCFCKSNSCFGFARHVAGLPIKPKRPQGDL